MTARRPVFLALLLVVFAEMLAAQQEGIVELKSARQLLGRVVNDEPVRELIGDVHFVQATENGGQIQVWCDRALQYLAQNRIELVGGVRVRRDSITILAPEGVYYGNTRQMEARNGVRLQRGRVVLTARRGEYFADEKRAHFVGRVVLVDSTSTVMSEDLTYFETEGRSVAIGMVHVYEAVNATDVYGDSLTHIDSTGYTRVTGNARLVRIDTSAGGVIDTMVVASTTLHAFRQPVQRFVAEKQVRVVRADMAARCGLATFEERNDRVRLDEKPIVWSGENQITGDSLTVFLRERRLRSLFAKGKAMAISRADLVRPDRFHQLTGREMTLFFSANKLERVIVERNATSLYYLYDAGAPNGVNRSSGDRITIDFAAGEAEQIHIAGSVEGKYFPERMIADREPEYNLDGFRWIADRPVRNGLWIRGN